MATDLAPRRLWQVPTFLTGLGCLLALWYGGDAIRPSLHERYSRAMAALRPAVDRLPPDVDQVSAALRKLPEGEPPADLAPQVKYLTGSAYVALAEGNPTATEAADWWQLARRDLEAAADHDLPLAEQKKLRYRLARAWANIPGTDPARTIDALSKYVTAGDDPAEGHRLLAKLHLATTPPDEAGARDALQNYLKHFSTRGDARSLNEARVQLAGLHAQLGEREEARKVIDRVGLDAPPEVYAAARLQLASFHRAEEEWAAAIRVWENVRDMKGAKEEQRAEALARLGEAYVKVGRADDAAGALREVGKTESPAGRAAWFKKAELALQDPSAGKDDAVIALEHALIGPDTAGFNKLVAPPESKRVCEAAYQRALQANDFAQAVRITHAYGKVAEAGDHHHLMVAAYQAWAESSQGDEAKARYRLAADAGVAGSKETPTGPKRADATRQAASLYLKAGDRARGLSLLAEFTGGLKDYPVERAGVAWMETGDIYLEANDLENARQAFQQASAMTGPAKERARVRLAALSYEADSSKGGTAAAAILEEVVTRPAVEAADKAAHEQASYLLGEIHLLQKAWPQAETRLKAALETYPQSPRAARGHYQYGQVMRHGAYESARQIKTDRATLEQIRAERITARKPALKIDEEVKLTDQIDRSQKIYEDMMRRAFDEFRQAEELFLATPGTADAEALKRTAFWAADCCYWLGNFESCATRCEKLVVRFRGRIEELEASRDLIRCCQFAAEASREAKDPDTSAAWTRRAAGAIEKARQSLLGMPATAFDGTSEVRTKNHWQNWAAGLGG